MKRCLAIVALSLFFLGAGTAQSAGRVLPGDTNVEPIRTTLTPKQRGEIARQIVFRWGGTVSRDGGSLSEWALKIGRLVGAADSANAQQAALMPSYQAMMGVLQGQPVSSPSVQSSIAAARAGRISSALIGSTLADTSYTPLPNGRCRVAVSGSIGAPLPGGVERVIDVANVVSYGSQGGTGSSAGDGSTNCGIPTGITALTISVTVQASAGQAGFFKIYENGQPFSAGNTVVYDTTYNATSDVIVKSCLACTAELKVYSSTPANYIIDVIGYFMPPQATALQCIDTDNVVQSVPAGSTYNVIASACPSGYTATATNCESGSWQMPFVFTHAGTCSAQNNSTSAAELRASRTCCRVPGR